jgi:uncharacterized protein YabN with tetrapyrrole methylase and pyrophosphatase domain
MNPAPDNAWETQRRGAGPALVIVGVGIQWSSQTTLAARRAIERSDLVLCAITDGGAADWLREINGRAESFAYPRNGRPRVDIYRAMVAKVIAALQEGKRVCAVFYGSPSVLTRPAHEALREARRQGYSACMLPGVSFLDCLFSDLGVDPGEGGCTLLEASQFLRTQRVIDPYTHLVLAQPAAIGQRAAVDVTNVLHIERALLLLQQKLTVLYGAAHRVLIYEAASHPLANFRADSLPLAELSRAAVNECSTLYVPPIGLATPDDEMCRLLEQLQSKDQCNDSSAQRGVEP